LLGQVRCENDPFGFSTRTPIAYVTHNLNFKVSCIEQAAGRRSAMLAVNHAISQLTCGIRVSQVG
jgi:hypothetical protein